MKMYSKDEVLAMADRLAKLDVYGCNREGAEMLRAFAHTLDEPVTVKWELIDELGETVSFHFDKLGHNFGKRGIDFDECFKIVSTPLYATPHQTT